MIGYAFCGSFCSFSESLGALSALVASGYEVQPIMSENAYSTDTRFGSAESVRRSVEQLCGREIIHTVVGAEPLGTTKRLDSLIIAPCTGNTLAKLALGITDTAVTMAAKAHLRRDGATLIALASNDGASRNLSSIAALLNRRSVFFVPMRQDAPEAKPHSLVADFGQIPACLEAMIRDRRQIRPLFV